MRDEGYGFKDMHGGTWAEHYLDQVLNNWQYLYGALQ